MTKQWQKLFVSCSQLTKLLFFWSVWYDQYGTYNVKLRITEKSIFERRKKHLCFCLNVPYES